MINIINSSEKNEIKDKISFWQIYTDSRPNELINLQPNVEFRLQNYPRQHLLVKSQQWKHQNNNWNLFKVNNKDTTTTSMASSWCSSLFIVNFEQISHIVLVFPFLILTLNE